MINLHLVHLTTNSLTKNVDLKHSCLHFIAGNFRLTLIINRCTPTGILKWPKILVQNTFWESVMSKWYPELRSLHKMVIAIIKKRDVHNEPNFVCCFIQFEKLSHKLLSKYQLKVKIDRLISASKLMNKWYFIYHFTGKLYCKLLYLRILTSKKGSNCSSDAF